MIFHQKKKYSFFNVIENIVNNIGKSFNSFNSLNNEKNFNFLNFFKNLLKNLSFNFKFKFDLLNPVDNIDNITYINNIDNLSISTNNKNFFNKLIDLEFDFKIISIPLFSVVVVSFLKIAFEYGYNRKKRSLKQILSDFRNRYGKYIAYLFYILLLILLGFGLKNLIKKLLFIWNNLNDLSKFEKKLILFYDTLFKKILKLQEEMNLLKLKFKDNVSNTEYQFEMMQALNKKINKLQEEMRQM